MHTISNSYTIKYEFNIQHTQSSNAHNKNSKHN